MNEFILGVWLPVLIDDIADLAAEGPVVAIGAGGFSGGSAIGSDRPNRRMGEGPPGIGAVESEASALGAEVDVQDMGE